MKKNIAWFLRVSTVLACVAVPCQLLAALSDPGTTHNPHFIGESFDFGEWTMDFDVATNAVANEAGEAFTLVFFTGALWCPWCTAWERDMLDGDPFREFARTNKIMLVEIDNPRRDGSAPTLLSTNVYSGAANDTRNGASGQEYIAGHGISDADAEAIAERNAALQVLWTTPGAERIGYPTMLLLRKDGNVAGRFSGYSWTADDTTVPVTYVFDVEPNMMRLAELLDMARTSSESGEELNNYVEWTPESLGLEDSNTATLRAVDRQDIYQLATEVGAYPVITVQGAGDVEVQVALLNDAGQTVQTQSGVLWAGVTLTAASLPQGQMYVSVSARGDAVASSSYVSTVYEYTVTTSQVREPGVVGFVRKMISMPHDIPEVVIELARTGGCYGAVSLTVKLDAAASTAVADSDFTDVFGASGVLVSWAAGESGVKTFTLPLLPGNGNDRTVALQISDVTGTVVGTDAERFTLTLKESDAPFFMQEEFDATAFTRVALDVTVPVMNTAGGKVSVTRRSGTLPHGIKASYDAVAGGLRLSGVPTKTGEYTAFFQVSEKIGSSTVKGGFVTVTVTVRELAEANLVAAQVISIAEGPVVDPDTRRVIGVVRFSMSRTGRMTAKYRGVDGNASFSARSWSGISDGGRVTVSVTNRARILTVALKSDGTFESSLASSGMDGQIIQYEVPLLAVPWTKDAPAMAYQGYYTASLSPSSVDRQGAWAPAGYSTMTISLPVTAIRSGSVKIAGTLADGTRYSGSALLAPYDDELGEQAHLAVFAKARKSTFGALLVIDAYAVESYQEWPSSVSSCGDSVPYWTMNSGVAETSFDLELDICGGYYNPADSLASYWEKYEGLYGSFQLLADGDLPTSGTYGIATNLPLIDLEIMGTSLRVPSKEMNPTKARLTLNKKQATIKGTFKIPFVNAAGKVKMMTATYSGVLLPGWTGDCGCTIDGAELPEKPFAMGSFWFSDKVPVSASGSNKSVTFKQGHPIIIQKAADAISP